MNVRCDVNNFHVDDIYSYNACSFSFLLFIPKTTGREAVTVVDVTCDMVGENHELTMSLYFQR
jgi:hypothetical protein